MSKARNTADLSNGIDVDASGNVGIGTSSPEDKLSLDQPYVASGEMAISFNQSNFANRATKIIHKMDASGNGGSLLFATNANGADASERMRIDSSGNLLVGKTSDSTITVGCMARADGFLASYREDNASALFGRANTDGDIAVFRKDSTTVGSIGVVNTSEPYFISSNRGIRISGNNIRPCSSGGANLDNVIDLGDTGQRFDDIYATNGTIQTSDQNEKQQIASLTDAEMTAAKAISKLFKTFKWNDSVAEKGDAARTHTGVIAQEVEAAMTDAGLNAGDYAFFISTTWWEAQTEVPAVEADEESGVEAQEAYTRTDTYDTLEDAQEGATERTRKGIRYPELLAFVGAATEQRLASIEARVTALEAI